MADDGPPGSGAGDPADALEPLDTFAARLGYLFETVHPRGQRAYSYEYMAETITRDYGIDISGNYIWMLRTGRRNNPTLRHMEGLARFFGVSPSFLTDRNEAERIRSRLEKIRDVADSGVQHVAMRGANVDDNTVEAIHALLDRARELTEGLRDANREPPPTDAP